MPQGQQRHSKITPQRQHQTGNEVQLMSQVVIANRLRDGIVVFLGRDHRWVEAIDACPPVTTAEEGEKILELAAQAEQNQEVIGPDLIDVEQRDGHTVPVKRREAIRAMGPTVRTDLGKQAGN